MLFYFCYNANFHYVPKWLYYQWRHSDGQVDTSIILAEVDASMKNYMKCPGDA